MINIKKEKEFVYIYNQFQSEFYFSKGILPVKVGRGSKGDPYTMFKNTDEVKLAFGEWCTRKK
jgi:hypothetical protein